MTGGLDEFRKGEMNMITIQEGYKVKSKQQVEEIWLADCRLTALTTQWLRAQYEGDSELAEKIKHQCNKLKQEMLKKYNIIM